MTHLISRRTIGIPLLTLALSACEKVVEEPVFEVVPRIELLEISTSEMVEFQDSLTVRLMYEDGDGDLGTSDPDINSIFVRDQRFEKPDGYYLRPMAPENASVSIRGELSVVIGKTFVLGNGDTERTIFSIYLVDRAGNQSNTVNTGEITIRRE